MTLTETTGMDNKDEANKMQLTECNDKKKKKKLQLKIADETRCRVSNKWTNYNTTTQLQVVANYKQKNKR